jgi:sugar (pentulose or hexulose) kinase
VDKGAVLVLDVGKTNSKLSLWSADARLIDARERSNERVRSAGGYPALDVEGVEAWMAQAMADLARAASIEAIVPIAHGAGAAYLAGGRLAAQPMCYEHDAAPELQSAYAALRDPFRVTGSPRLPHGLNLGAQLYELEQRMPQLASPNVEIVTFAQYWAWVLSGIAASEVTTLGCHADLWRPFDRRFSDLAFRRGWARRFAPLRRAYDRLGSIRPHWADVTGLPQDCVVLCGAHDSNAAFWGVRGHPELAGRDVTVISTGTWFVAMRAPAADAAVDVTKLDETRDVLVNVDVEGRPAPSARFMGGREVERLIGDEASPLRDPEFVRNIVPCSLDDVFQAGAMVLPTYAPGVGPFPSGEGRWVGPHMDGPAMRAAVGLYLALVADASLSLIGSRDAIVVEGRFSADTSFVRMLATLRPDCDVYAADASEGLAFGALRLADKRLTPRSSLRKMQPLTQDVKSYVRSWRERSGVLEALV